MVWLVPEATKWKWVAMSLSTTAVRLFQWTTHYHKTYLTLRSPRLECRTISMGLRSCRWPQTFLTSHQATLNTRLHCQISLHNYIDLKETTDFWTGLQIMCYHNPIRNHQVVLLFLQVLTLLCDAPFIKAVYHWQDRQRSKQHSSTTVILWTCVLKWSRFVCQPMRYMYIEGVLRWLIEVSTVCIIESR